MRILVILLMSVAVAKAQCPQDTIFYGGNPPGAFHWSQGHPMVSDCPMPCIHNTWNCWQFPDTMNGYISIGGNSSMPFGYANIVVLQNCNSVLLDTCAQIGHPFVAPLNLNLNLPVNSQVCIFWDSTTTDSVGVLSKNEPSGKATLIEVIYMMDTCGVQSWLQPPVHVEPVFTRMDTWTVCRIPLRPGMYVEERAGSRRMIRVVGR